MPARKTKPAPEKSTVTWTARLVGQPTLTLGWSSTEEGSNEVSYLLLPCEFRTRTWPTRPGVLSIFASDRPTHVGNAGTLMSALSQLRMADITTSRNQFTELVYFVQANRTGSFSLHVEESTGAEANIVGWSVSIELRNG